MVELVTHGTLDYGELARLNITPDELLVFSSNINPYGPPPEITNAVAAAVTGPNLARYPDRLSGELRKLVADYHGVDAEAVVVGNGTADLLWIVGLLFLGNATGTWPPADSAPRVTILEPTFGEYANVASLMGTPVNSIALPGWKANGDGTYTPGERTLADCCQELAESDPAVVFVCNPNNPTGELFNRAQVVQLVDSAPDALWIIDEAYMEFAEQAWSATELMGRYNVLILRSMTKDFALGGIRLGYLVTELAAAQQIQTAQPPWNTNVLAQVAGQSALASLAWRQATLAQLRHDTEDFRSELQAAGWSPRPTTANYFLTPVANPADLRAYLLERRMLIRDCTSFGLPHFFRVATQTPAENAQLVAALRDYSNEAQAQ